MRSTKPWCGVYGRGSFGARRLPWRGATLAGRGLSTPRSGPERAAQKHMEMVSRALLFASRWSLAQTMVFERECFHPKLRMSIGDKRDLLQDALAVWMHDGRTLIGETYGTPIQCALKDSDEDGRADLLPYRRRAVIYVYSTAIRPRWQGRGLSKILNAYFLGRATQAGYRIAIGHAKEGASCALNRSFGARLGAGTPTGTRRGSRTAST